MSHDLIVVQVVCDRIYVMRAGQVVESGATDAILTAPYHPYIRALIEAAPGRWFKALLVPGLID